MFPPIHRKSFAQIALDALAVARAFLLLEDGYDGVVTSNPTSHAGLVAAGDSLDRCAARLGRGETAWEEPARRSHPHRQALRELQPRSSRRPGVPAPREHVCLCPVRREAAGRGPLRA